MKTLKITQGKLEVTFSQDYSNEFYLNAVGDSFNNPTFGEQPHNAKLIEEAFAVANETGKTPRELLERNNELLEAAQDMVKALQEEVSLGSDPNVYKCFQANQKLIQAINKASDAK